MKHAVLLTEQTLRSQISELTTGHVRGRSLRQVQGQIESRLGWPMDGLVQGQLYDLMRGEEQEL